MLYLFTIKMAKVKSNRMREVYFTSKGAESSAGAVFNSIYSSLDPLIAHNNVIALREGNLLYQAGQAKAGFSRDAENLFSDAMRKVSSLDHGAIMTVHFDDHSRKVYKIKPRTNFDPTLVKRPNVLYLESLDGDTKILREARSLDETAISIPLLERHAREQVQGKYKGLIYSGMVPSSSDCGRTDVFVLSENQLVMALEQIYAEGIADRITPKIDVVGASDSRVWYARDFLRSARDMSLNLGSFLNYEGTLNGLGLMDILDNQVEHYCLDSKGRVVNIDPDFWTFTKNSDIIDNHDWREFKRTIGGMRTSGQFIDDDARHKRTETARDVRKNLGTSTLLDYIPRRLADAPALKFLAIENAHLENLNPHLD